MQVRGIGFGAVHGLVPKIYLPTYNEFYESRWFASGSDFLDGRDGAATIRFAGEDVRISPNMLSTLRPQTRICLAANITCADENIKTRTVTEWRKLIPQNASDEQVKKYIPQVPAIFLIYK